MSYRCSSSFKKTLATALLFLFFLFLLDDPDRRTRTSRTKRRTLREVFEERKARMENYCKSQNKTRFCRISVIFSFASTRPKTPLKDLLPPKKPNFHILENLRRPILLCAPKKVGNHFHFLTLVRITMTTNCTLGVFKVGSMTFFWAVLSHLDEEDGAVWIHGPNRSTRYKKKINSLT